MWHDAHLAGRWYPAHAATLRAAVQAHLEAAAEARAGQALGAAARGLVVPHAGYPYSGAVAAYAYRQVRGARFRRVVVMAPSHFVALRRATVLRCEGFTTPLGQVLIDNDAVDLLLNDTNFEENAEAFADEHALEIQLPFVQTVLPRAVVVPLLLGQLDREGCRAVARGLNRLDRSDTLFVVSSDFTHYGARFGYQPFPAAGAASVREGLRRLDMGAVDAVCAGDADAFRHYVEATGATICGRVPIAVFLEMHPGRRGRLLRYQTSLDVTGDFEHCVSYASIAFPSAMN